MDIKNLTIHEWDCISFDTHRDKDQNDLRVLPLERMTFLNLGSGDS